MRRRLYRPGDGSVRHRLGAEYLKRHASDVRLQSSDRLLVRRRDFDHGLARFGDGLLPELVGDRLYRLSGLLHRQRLIAEEPYQLDPMGQAIHLQEQLFLGCTGELDFRGRRRLRLRRCVHGVLRRGLVKTKPAGICTRQTPAGFDFNGRTEPCGITSFSAHTASRLRW